MKKFSQKQFLRSMIYLAIVIFAVSGWVWWHQIRNNPRNVFFGSIENSLRTNSITRQAEYNDSDQMMRISISPELRTRTINTQTNNTKDGKIVVQTEAINTSEAEYVRWTKIDTDQTNKKGEKLNFNHLINVWGKNEADPSNQFSQLQMSLLSGIVPNGRFNIHERQALMKVVRDENVYKFDNAKMIRKIELGRPVYEYEVEVNPQAFYKFIKKYGEIANLPQLKDIDPSQFKDIPSEIFKVKVDVWSRHITGIADSTGNAENISGYGEITFIDPPKKSIPLNELQSKLQSIHK